MFKLIAAVIAVVVVTQVVAAVGFANGGETLLAANQ